MPILDWLYDRIAKRRGWLTSEQNTMMPVEIRKNLEQYSQIAVAPSYGKAPEPAAWTNDRNEFVTHYRNSVYVAVGAIARKVAMQPVIVSRRVVTNEGETLEPVPLSHPLQELFMAVNPRDTQWDLWFYTAAWRFTLGDTYWWKARNGFGTPKELWHFPPQWVHVIPSETEYVGKYMVRGVFGKKEAYFDPNEIIHMREPSLDWSGNGRYYGTPALQAAATPVDLEDSMYRRLYHLFKNYAPPSEKFWTDQELGEDQLKDIYMQIMSQHRLAEQTGRPMITHSGLKPIGGQTASEMDYARSLDVTMEKILSIFGVPKAVVGLTKDSNRANMEAAMLTFCENTVNPLLSHIGQHLTQGLAQEFEPDLVVHFDPCGVNDVKALQEAWKMASSANAVTPDEIRDELLGKGPLRHGGNVVRDRNGVAIDAGNDEPSEMDDDTPNSTPAASASPDDDSVASDDESMQNAKSGVAERELIELFDDELRKALSDLPKKKGRSSKNGTASGKSRLNGSSVTLSHSSNGHTGKSSHDMPRSPQ